MLPNPTAWEDRHQPRQMSNSLLIQRKRTETMTQHQDCLGSKQFALEDDVSYKCSCCEAGGTKWKRTQTLHTKKPRVRFSSLTAADINFFEKGELQQNTWAPLPKALVVDSGAGETVIPVDWLTKSPMVQERMISVQQLMVAKCKMKDTGNWMFALLTGNSEGPWFFKFPEWKRLWISKPNAEEREQACFWSRQQWKRHVLHPEQTNQWENMVATGKRCVRLGLGGGTPANELWSMHWGTDSPRLCWARESAWIWNTVTGTLLTLDPKCLVPCSPAVAMCHVNSSGLTVFFGLLRN